MDDASQPDPAPEEGRDALRQRVSELEAALTSACATIEELEAQTRQLRTVTAEFPDYVVQLDRERRFLWVNRYHPDLRPDQVIGHKIDEFLAPDTVQASIAAIEKAFESGLPVSVDSHAFLPDGYERWSSDRIIPLDQDPPIVLLITRETTEQMRAQIALQKSEEKYRAYITNSPYGVFVADAKGNYLEANAAACAMTGFDEAQLCSMSISDLVVPDPAAQERVIATSKTLAETGRVRTEGWMRRKEGGRFLASVDAVRIADDRFIAFCADITEHRNMEAQLRHAQRLESLGLLAGGIAHDFNNLLVGILGNADLALASVSSTSPVCDNIHNIQKAGTRAADLATQMLAYSGRGRFVVEPIDLAALIEEMAHLLQVAISKKAVLEHNFTENTPTFDGDATQVRQIVMNLITNASEAIGDERGLITLSTRAIDCDRAYLDGVNEILRASLDEPLPEGAYVCLDVADTGCGMDAETIEKVFDPFFSTKFTGRGLGMSTVLGIVRGHKGALNIHSEVGKGTTFQVLFPANDPSKGGPAPGRGNEAEKRSSHTGGTVLVVDDEEAVRSVCRQMLQRMGFGVLTAPDGREALKVLAEHPHEIVCVILDLTMPRMDGEEAFHEMRRLDPAVTVVLCSGYDEHETSQRFRGEGPAAFIKKPFTMATLKEKMNEALPNDQG